MSFYVADFETTVPDIDDTEENIHELNTRVWSWGVAEINAPETFIYGTDISEFFDWCTKIKKKKTVYFHNLKFDGKFLIDYLLRNGYEYDETRKNDKSFTCLISEYGQFYSIEVTFKVYTKDRISTTFYDSSKKIPLSVSEIAKSFNLPIQKGSIDYKKDRPPGYEPTQEELEYLANDVNIIGSALHIQHAQGLQKMTVGGDSLFHYKTLVGKNFNNWFPDITDEQGIMFQNLKFFYRGGFTYVNEKYQGQDIKTGLTYDVTSLYPSVMKDELLPYDQPIHFDGKYIDRFSDIYPLYCQSILVEFKLKPGKIPFVHDQFGYHFNAIEYMSETEPYRPVYLYLTNTEMDLFYDNYEVIDIQYCGGYMFKGQHNMFTQYINHWIEIKETADRNNNPGLRTIAKLMLNSLYGKFGKNVFVGGKIPEIDPEKNKVVYRNKKVVIEKGLYIPIAIFVTSYARVKMIKSAQSCHDRFLYCDTDSLHLMGVEPPTTIDIDPYKLGSWKLEYIFKKARYLRAKAYIQEAFIKNKSTGIEELKTIIKCSGMTEDIKKYVTFDNFHFGFSAHGKKAPRTINGGVVLVETTYTLTG